MVLRKILVAVGNPTVLPSSYILQVGPYSSPSGWPELLHSNRRDQGYLNPPGPFLRLSRNPRHYTNVEDSTGRMGSRSLLEETLNVSADLTPTTLVALVVWMNPLLRLEGRTTPPSTLHHRSPDSRACNDMTEQITSSLLLTTTSSHGRYFGYSLEHNQTVRE